MADAAKSEAKSDETDDTPVSEKMPLVDLPSSRLGETGSQQTQVASPQPLMRRLWALHFVISLLVIVCGIIANKGERKYTPADPKKIPGDCRKAFVNVFAGSPDDNLAVVCCGPESIVRSPMCSAASKPLPLAGSLAMFPQAWLIPLLPIFVRILIAVVVFLFGFLPGESLRTTLLRLAFYIATLNFRGWVLYVFLNRVESKLVPPTGDKCWYREYLREPSCQTTVFDYSDHMVLYFAQILPVPLMEMLHSLVVPFWRSGTLLLSKERKVRIKIVVPVLLFVGLGYLYIITLMGAFKTTAYFHIGSEITVGYLISLTVQGPYAFLQCSVAWDGLRHLLFGFPPTRARND